MEHRHSNSDKTYNAQVDEGVVPTSSVVQPIRKERGLVRIHGAPRYTGHSFKSMGVLSLMIYLQQRMNLYVVLNYFSQLAN